MEAVQRAVERYRIAWEKARDRRDRILADAVREKATLPDHYWQAEHKARMQYHSAMILAEAFTMTDDTPDTQDYRR